MDMDIESKPNWLKRIGVGVLIVVILGGIFFAGVSFGSKQPPKIIITNPKDIVNLDFSLFWEAVRTLKDNYVDVSGVTDKKILDGAIKGALGATNDPYTTYFPPVEAEKFQQDLSGSFGGIGAELGFRNGQVIVIAPLKGSPAERAGIKAADAIFKIDATSTEGMSVDDAVKIIRGVPGTKLKLEIFRDGWKKEKTFEITREVIQVPTADFEIKDGNVGYIHLYNFNANSPQLFYNAAFSTLTRGAHGIILDLRNNPGGFLDAAVDISGWFVKRGEAVVKERLRNGEVTERRANGNEAFLQMPVVVLVNEGSASAAEILAGALRDLRGAKLVGQKTFGKGSVQEIQSLSDGSQLKITVAKWLTPADIEIDKKGLEPDAAVEIKDEDTAKGRDPQLEKAVELLKSQIR